MASPFEVYVTAKLDFLVSDGTLTTDISGNVVPGRSLLSVTAKLSQSTAPNWKQQPGQDARTIYLSGRAVEPMMLPSVVTPDSPCQCTFQGYSGQFVMNWQTRSPFGTEQILGDKIQGWFTPGSFTVSGDPYTQELADAIGAKQYAPEAIAAASLSALRIVALNDSGRLIYADSSIADHAFRVQGILETAISAGYAIAPLSDGSISDGSWNWAIGIPVFLGTDGILTQTAPESGFILQVATVENATSLSFEIQPPILIG